MPPFGNHSASDISKVNNRPSHILGNDDSTRYNEDHVACVLKRDRGVRHLHGAVRTDVVCTHEGQR